MLNLLHTLNKYKIDDFLLVDVGAKGSIEIIQGIERITEVHAFEPNPIEFEALQKKIHCSSIQKTHFKSYCTLR
jgi:hypothetical protein